MQNLKLVYVGGAEKNFVSDISALAREAFSVDIEMIVNRITPLSTIKPMNGLGNGVCELRKNGRPAYRCVYVIKNDTIYVLHAFTKTSDDTPKKHETTIKQRFKLVK
jgi:phage-related protein